MIQLNFLLLFLNYFIFVEAAPLMSMSQDLSIILQCNATSPVDKKNLNVVLVEKRFNEDVNDQFKCFLFCLYFNYKWMDDKGAFLYEDMRKALTESNLDDVAIEYLTSTCTGTEVTNKCDRAFTFTECFWTESEKLEKNYLSQNTSFH